MSQLVIRALRVLLILIALGALGAQTVIVFVVATHPESDLADRAVAYAALGVAAIACVEVALVALWVLLSMVRRDAIFDERAFRWVDVITVAGLVAAVVVAGLCAHVGEIDDAPGLVLIGGGVAIGGAAFALLMVVMRGLLRSATVFRRELDEVV
ncbi:DUF2975 domain-containing protein [Pseudonocardia nigra]|uniref:DUF2975 domain-containing protein n=1 Tax=Pseudonocardia nigra TaxID=1921578 RepID=UPI001C5D06CB|nr:DUF2975 domain-containing protein [Pseudonocardia nigra]